ncbi:tetratricopeptide repeat protein, partial [Limobrevibacterium gyesilva]|nr:tetratricopeptide repeat protein [Limobrevibacterium gyesilva]
MPPSRAAEPLTGTNHAVPDQAATPKTSQEWFQDLAQDAWRRGQAAMAAGDMDDALRWLERAHRIGPRDAAVALALATVRLRLGAFAEAASLLDDVVGRHDLREAWLTLAVVRRGLADPAGAAVALAQALSRHVLPDEAGIAALADAVAAEAGLPGWCGLRADGHVAAMVPDGAKAKLSVDGMRLAPGARVPDTAAAADVTVGGRALLGSPLAVAQIRRIEGVVAVRDGGLEGWAWHPGDPDADPVLTVRSAAGKALFTLTADDTRMLAPGPLARPRRFHVPASRFARLAGAVRVTGRDGRDLLGSPLTPGAEQSRAADAARAVAALFPAAGRRRHAGGSDAAPTD